MSAKSRRSVSSNEQSSADSSSTQVQNSNQTQQDKVRSEEGTSKGLANYQATLGKWLGTELYSAIAPHLSQEAIGEYADQGLMAALHAIASAASSASDNVDPAVFERLVEALEAEYGNLASQFIDQHGTGLVNALGNWADANPRAVVSIALLAAAAAVICDMDIPELKHRFRLNDSLALRLGADIGSFRNITLERITAALEFQSGPLVAAIQVSHDKNKGASASLSGGFKSNERELTGDVTLGKDGIEAYGVTGILQHGEHSTRLRVEDTPKTKPKLSLEIEGPDGIRKNKTNVDYDFEEGLLSVGRNSTEELAGGILSTGTSVGADASISRTANWEGQVSDDLSLRHGMTTTTALDGSQSNQTTLGATLDRSDLVFSLDSSFGTQGSYDLDASLKYDKNDWMGAAELSTNSNGASDLSLLGEHRIGNHRMGANADLNIADGLVEEVGVYYGFQDPNEFRSFLAEYRYNLGAKRHEFDATIEQELFDIRWRAIEKLRVSPDEMTSSTELLGAKSINDDLALLGGGRFDYSSRGGRGTFIPEVGVQFKDVPIVLEYNPEEKSVGVSVRLKF